MPPPGRATVGEDAVGVELELVIVKEAERLEEGTSGWKTKSRFLMNSLLRGWEE